MMQLFHSNTTGWFSHIIKDTSFCTLCLLLLLKIVTDHKQIVHNCSPHVIRLFFHLKSIKYDVLLIYHLHIQVSPCQFKNKAHFSFLNQGTKLQMDNELEHYCRLRNGAVKAPVVLLIAPSMNMAITFMLYQSRISTSNISTGVYFGRSEISTTCFQLNVGVELMFSLQM